MKQFLKQIAFKFAHSRPGGWMIWFILRYFPFLIPFKKLHQDPYLIAISHPVPSYATHILLLPRIYLPDLLALNIHNERDQKFVHSIQKALNVLLDNWEQTNMQLVINGGNNQDVKLLHMHLIEINLDITQFEYLHADNCVAGLSKLILTAQHCIKNTEHNAYRLLFSYTENQIQLQLQITM